MNNFKFGFEYECFIEIDNAYFIFLLNQLLSKQLTFNYTDEFSPNDSRSNSQSQSKTKSKEHYTEEELFWRLVRRDDDSISNVATTEKNQFERFLIASFLNTIDPEIQFQVAPRYAKTPVNIFALFQHKKIPSKTHYWSITSDSSVKKELCKNPFYKNSDDKKRYNINNCDKIIENIELVSPIIKWDEIKHSEDDKNLIGRTLNTIIPCKGVFDFWHNHKTSNHVHISKDNAFQEERNVIKICLAWWYFEPLFLSFVKTWRSTSEYAKSMNKIIEKTTSDKKSREAIFMNLNDENFKDVLPYNNQLTFFENIFNVFQGISRGGKYDRNAGLNLLNLPTVSTIEIRLKEGSTNTYDINMYIKFFAYFFDAVCRKKAISSLLNHFEKLRYWSVKTSGRKCYLQDMWNSLFVFMKRNDTYENDFIKVFDYWKEKHNDTCKSSKLNNTYSKLTNNP